MPHTSAVGKGLYLAALAVLIGCAGVTASEEQADEKAAASRQDPIEQAVADLNRQRQVLERRIAELAEEEESESQNDRLTLLRSIDATRVQQGARLSELRQFTEMKGLADKALESLETYDPNEPKPYSFLLLDDLQDQLAVAEQREKVIRADRKIARQLLRIAHEELNAAEKDRQSLVEAAKAGDEKSATAEEIELAELQVEHARAKVELRQTTLDVLDLRDELSATQQKQLAKQIKVIEKDVAFSGQDRSRQRDALARQTANLMRQKREVESRLQSADAEQRHDLQKLTQEQAPPALQQAAATARRIARDAYRIQSDLLDRERAQVDDLLVVWDRRYDVANDEVRSHDAKDWHEEIEGTLEHLKETIQSLETARDAARDEQASLEREENDSEEILAWKDFGRSRLQDVRDLASRQLEQIKTHARVLDRFRGELQPFVKEPESRFGVFGTPLKSMLGMEVEDATKEVTLGAFLMLLAAIVAAIILAYAISRFIGTRVLPKIGLQPGVIAAIKSIVFYLLVVIFGFIAFQLLRVPLAAFAFLGGAAAIAVGFGSTDIMNNFMSGIILLTEQPIRVGDYVKLDAVQGVVVHMGLRSTRVRTDANYEVTVPNKTLLAGSLTNLTLSDSLVQMTAKVSIAREVVATDAKRKMMEVAFAHPMVLKSPRPTVVLKEFDPYWMTFEIYFWVQHVNYIRTGVVQSEIMEAICDMYRPQAEGEAAAASESTTKAAESAPPTDLTTADVNGHREQVPTGR